MIAPDEFYACLRKVPHAAERGERDLTFIERQIWRLSQGLPRTFASMLVGKALVGRLDQTALEEALALVQRRHDATWTRFVTRDGAPIAQLEPDLRAPLRVVDASSPEDARRRLLDEQAVGFELAVGPLFRYLLVRIGPEQQHLIVVTHHINCDYWGLVRLSEELNIAYRALCAGAPPVLPPVRVHNRDLSAWQKAWYRDCVRAEYEAYWQSQRCEAPVVPTLRAMREPTDHRRATRGKCSMRVSPTTCAAIGAYCVAHSRSVATLLFGALAMLLHGEGAARRVAIGVFSANRRKETIAVVGNLAVILPVCIEVAPELASGELVDRAHAVLADALRHQDAPPSASDAPGAALEPFRVAFNCFARPARQLFEVDGLRAASLPVPSRTHTFYDLEFQVATFHDSSIVIRLEYNADAIEADVAAEVLQRYQQLVTRMVADPARTVREILL